MSDKNVAKIEAAQKKLARIEEEMLEVEEEASEQFRKWYKLNEDRSAAVEEARALVRDTRFEGKEHDYGVFKIRRFEQEVADITDIRKRVPKVFELPGVVTKVDIKALRSAIAAGDVDSKEAIIIEDCIEKVEGTPRILGPKAVEL